ncbi:MAG: CRISPR-associated protein [Thermodesulfobacteriota bacterium]
MEKDDISRVEKEYWHKFEASQINEVVRYYVCEGHKRLEGKSLLDAELDHARREGHLTDKPCETLVLLLGFSLEPLLQSVCVYQPRKVVLVLNEKGYAGEEWQVFASHVTEAIDHLVDKGLLTQKPQVLGKDGVRGYPAADQPEAVFQLLVKVLHEETNAVKVVIDVTGGKKSMVSGAYLYAAYSGVRISYVDFDEYDPEHRRPYGYSCMIGELANPYQEFALREWERVRELYGRYQFREARSVLERDVLPAMKRVMPETETQMGQLAEFLKYYEQWDGGNYGAAKRAAQNLPNFAQPSAVTELGDQWFEFKGNDFAKKPKHFYVNLPALHAYSCDELRRIQRLIDYNEDYRSAFLRAGGVNEMVMLARIVTLITNSNDRNSLLNSLDERTPDARKVFTALLDDRKSYIDVKKDVPFRGAPNISIPHRTPMNPWWKATSLFGADDGWNRFIDKRNELTHKYFSVPSEWAEEALKFVQANFEDFLGHSIEGLGLRTAALPWRELCALSGINRSLPPSLRMEA